MLGAQVFVLQLRHFSLRVVERLAKIRTKIRGGASMDCCAPGEFSLQLLVEFRGLHSEFFEQGADEAIALAKQSKQKVFVGGFGVVAFRGEIQRSAQGLLHLRGKLVRAHSLSLAAPRESKKQKSPDGTAQKSRESGRARWGPHLPLSWKLRASTSRNE